MKQKHVESQTKLTLEVLRMEEYFNIPNIGSYYTAINGLLKPRSERNMVSCTHNIKQNRAAMTRHVQSTQMSLRLIDHEKTLDEWIKKQFRIPMAFVHRAFDDYKNRYGRLENVERFVLFLLEEQLFTLDRRNDKGVEQTWDELIYISITQGNLFLFYLAMSSKEREIGKTEFIEYIKHKHHGYLLIAVDSLEMYLVFKGINGKGHAGADLTIAMTIDGMEIAKYLIDNGVDMFEYATHYANRSNMCMAILFERYAILKYFIYYYINHGGDVNKKSIEGYSLVKCASIMKDDVLARYLIDHGAREIRTVYGTFSDETVVD